MVVSGGFIPRRGVRGGGQLHAPFFLLFSSVTYGGDDNTATPLWYIILPPNFSVGKSVGARPPFR